MGSAKCPNCGAGLGCSCQLRTASDGKQVCNNCATKYEKELEVKKINRKEETT